MPDPRAILDYLGFEYEEKGTRLALPCPLPEHADTTPSMSIWEDGRFYCFGCEERGDLIDLYARVREMPRDRAQDEIAKFTGEPISAPVVIDKRPELRARAVGEERLADLRLALPQADHARAGERLDKTCWVYRKGLIDEAQLEGAMGRFLDEVDIPGSVS